MELKLADSGAAVSLSDVVFGKEYNEGLVHQAVVAFRAAGRSGTKAQKTRAEVSGGGAKPWRQKGTGRARAGTTRGPIWRHGGVTFAAKPRDHGQKLNKKMYRAAMRSILSQLVREDRLVAVDSLSLEAGKTKELVSRLGELSLDSVLIVSDQVDEKLFLACRNLPWAEVTEVGGVDPVRLLRYSKVLVTAGALNQIEGWLK